MKKYKAWAYILITFLLCGIFYYYKERFITAIKHPKDFILVFAHASQITKFSLSFFLSSLGISTFAFLIELLIVGWSNSALKRTISKPSKSAWIDNLCYLLSITKLFEFISFVSTLGIFYFLISLLQHVMQPNLGSYIPNKYIQFAFLFILADFINYLRHRFNHWGALWELHNYHHSAKEFNIITSTRGSFLEAGFNSIFFSIIYFIGGISLEPIVLVIVARELHIQLNHSNINSSYGIIGKYILLTPLDHKLHHSIHQEDYDKNFGAVFKWWDILFKTYKKPCTPIEIGITDADYENESFIRGQLNANKRFAQKTITFFSDRIARK